MALSPPSTIACCCVVLLAVHTGDGAGGAGIPSKPAPGASTAIVSGENPLSRQAAVCRRPLDLPVDNHSIRCHRQYLVDSTKGLLHATRPSGRSAFWKWTAGGYCLDWPYVRCDVWNGNYTGIKTQCSGILFQDLGLYDTGISYGRRIHPFHAGRGPRAALCLLDPSVQELVS